MANIKQPIEAQNSNPSSTQNTSFQNLMQWREENKKHLLSDGDFVWYLNNLHAFYHKFPLWANEDDKWE